jgi:hypothetical protein
MADIQSADYTSTLTCPMDMVARPQPKSFCPFGCVCLARLEVFDGSPYTGLLSPGGARACLLRLSTAAKPPCEGVTSRIGRAALWGLGGKLRRARLFPCVALKAFRGDSRHSGNLLFGGCKTGQPEDDFFAHCVCTQLTERVALPLRPGLSKFRQYSAFPLSLGVSDFCSYAEDGSSALASEAGARFPFCLVLRPIRAASDPRISADAGAAVHATERPPVSERAAFDGFIDALLAVPEGTRLYDVFACPDPSAVSDPSRLEKIGRIVTTSAMRESGPDDSLFFKHQRKEEDYALRPEWKSALRRQCSPDGGRTVGTVAELAGWELFESALALGSFVDCAQRVAPEQGPPAESGSKDSE